MKTNCFFCKKKDAHLDHGRTYICTARGIIDFPPHNCPDFDVDKDKLQLNLAHRVSVIQKQFQSELVEIQECLEILGKNDEFKMCLLASGVLVCEELSALSEALKKENAQCLIK